MLHTVQCACTLPKAEADALNAESGRIYTERFVSHYRLYRKQGVWLTRAQGERWEDRHGGPTTLPAHSRDAAQQGFYQAGKTARSCRQLGLEVKYPYKRKRWRTTCWKQLGMRLRAGVLLLARARGLPPVEVALPSNLLALPATAFLEARLVWDRAARHDTWHLVIEDGTKPTPPHLEITRRQSTWGRCIRRRSPMVRKPSSSPAAPCAPIGRTPPNSSPHCVRNRRANGEVHAPFVGSTGARVASWRNSSAVPAIWSTKSAGPW